MINNGGIFWIIAAFVGFLVWWPIGVAFLVTIFATAVMQQLTGYAAVRRDPPRYVGEDRIIEPTQFDRQLEDMRQRNLKQIEARAIERKLK